MYDADDRSSHLGEAECPGRNPSGCWWLSEMVCVTNRIWGLNRLGKRSCFSLAPHPLTRVLHNKPWRLSYSEQGLERTRKTYRTILRNIVQLLG